MLSDKSRVRLRTSRPNVLAIAVSLGLLTLGPVLAQNPSVPPSTPLPLLTTARQVRSLTAAEAAREYPVSIDAVVTYSDHRFNVMWVQDETSGIFVSLKEKRTTPFPKAGQHVKVVGLSKPGEFAPCMRELDITILGPGRKIEPVRPTFSQMMTGKYTSQYVELQGTVHSGKIDEEHLLLSLHTTDGKLRVSMEDYPTDWEKTILHAKIRARGAMSTNFNSRRQIIGVHLFVPQTSMHILEPAAPDPFAIPLTALENLGRFRIDGTPEARVRVRGTVTGTDGANMIYLSDTSARLAVACDRAAEINPGDMVEAVGYFSVAENKPSLEDAVVRRVGTGLPIAPEHVTGHKILPEASGTHGLGTTYDLTIVTIDGTLLRIPNDAKDRSLLLQDERGVFVATLAADAAGKLPNLEPGSQLRLKGVCVVNYNKRFAIPESFRILLRDSSDIAVLKKASWWNLRHSMWVLAGIATFIPIVLGWVWLLRKRVSAQTGIITAKLQAEAQLESRYRRLFERNLAAFARTTAQGKFLDCNPAAARLLGFTSPGDLIGRNLKEFCIQADTSLNALSENAEAGALQGIDLSMRDQSGGMKWALTSAVRADSDGDDPVLEYTFIDITQRRQFESALRVSEEKYRTLFDCVSEPVFIADATTRLLVDWNLEARRKYGYTPEILREMTIDDLIDPSSEIDISLNGTKSREHCTHRTREGQFLDVEVATEQIEYEGQPAIMMIVHDVSKQRRFERELMSARDAAEAANKTKGEFLANMSHEIRTPLNGILGMTELALAGELPTEEREYLNLVKLSADSLLTVINDILDFSKIEAGKLDLEHIPFDLRATLSDTLKTVAGGASNKGLELIFDVDDDVPNVVMGDPTRLRQVVLNLAGNAIKFTAEGEIALRVRMDATNGSAPSILFEVSDTGIGIPAHKQSSVFEAFSQADGSTTRQYGGTGLGLTICSRLVKLMEGHIWLKSEPGKGSCFSFSVPFEAAQQVDDRQPAALLPGVVPSGLRVLVVDDHAANRSILDRMLRKLATEVTTANDGESAHAELLRASAAGRPYGLLLSDVNMEGIDGFGLARCVRLDSRTARIPIVLLTSAGRAGDSARCRELGISACLTKPLSRDELHRAVCTAIAGSEITQAETAAPKTQDLVSLNILLAEDNAVNQAVATRLLEKSGHHVHVAADGIEALEALQSNTFDLILMDVQMPRMDGLDTTRRIREIETMTGRHVPIIAMTAHAMKGDADRCFEAGMDSYVSKPISAAKLYGAIDELKLRGEAAVA